MAPVCAAGPRVRNDMALTILPYWRGAPGRDRGLSGADAARRGRPDRGVPHRQPSWAPTSRATSSSWPAPPAARGGEQRAVRRHRGGRVRCRADVDTLMVAGGLGRAGGASATPARWPVWPARRPEPAGDERVHRRVPARRRPACSTGRRATTHWGRCRALARRYPDVRRRRLTASSSAMATSGRRRASPPAWTWHWPSSRTTTAPIWRERWRAGSCCSCSARADRRSSRPTSRSRCRTARTCGPCSTPSPTIPAGDLSVAALARQAGLSERHLARMFRAETGTDGRRSRRGRAGRDGPPAARERAMRHWTPSPAAAASAPSRRSTACSSAAPASPPENTAPAFV